MLLWLQSMFLHAYQSYLFNRILSRRKGLSSKFKDLKIDDIVLILDEQKLPTQAQFWATEKNFEHLNHLINTNKAVIGAPIIGFESEIINHDTHKMLEKENVRIEDFKSDYKEFNRKGTIRPILLSPINLKIVEIVPDELNINTNKVILEFSLKKGEYASIVIEEFIKNKIKN